MRLRLDDPRRKRIHAGRPGHWMADGPACAKTLAFQGAFVDGEKILPTIRPIFPPIGVTVSPGRMASLSG